MLFFKLAGYTDATIELMGRVAPRVAAKAFERLSPDFDAALNAKSDRCLWPKEWLAILQQARGAKKETCPPLHQILRVHDGQVSWYDKEPVEKHTSGCLYCLDRWTALREVNYWRRAAPAVSQKQVEEWLRVLPVRADEKRNRFFAACLADAGCLVFRAACRANRFVLVRRHRAAFPVAAVEKPIAERQEHVVAALEIAVMQQMMLASAPHRAGQPAAEMEAPVNFLVQQIVDREGDERAGR